MKRLFVVLLLAACNDAPNAAGDLAGAVDLMSPVQVDTDLGARCSPACSTAQFCYAGAEPGFFQGDGGVALGCNPLPNACAQDCACLLRSFAFGFCTCSLDGAVPTVRCSFG